MKTVFGASLIAMGLLSGSAFAGDGRGQTSSNSIVNETPGWVIQGAPPPANPCAGDNKPSYCGSNSSTATTVAPAAPTASGEQKLYYPRTSSDASISGTDFCSFIQKSVNDVPVVQKKMDELRKQIVSDAALSAADEQSLITFVDPKGERALFYVDSQTTFYYAHMDGTKSVTSVAAWYSEGYFNVRLGPARVVVSDGPQKINELKSKLGSGAVWAKSIGCSTNANFGAFGSASGSVAPVAPMPPPANDVPAKPADEEKVPAKFETIKI